MSDTIEILDAIPEGEEVLASIYEIDASAPTREAAHAAIADRARKFYDQWARQNGGEHRLALANVSEGRTPGGGRHAYWIGADVVAVGPARGRLVACDPEEQATLSGVRAPSRADHRRVLRSALAAHERGRPVMLDAILPSLIALVLASDEDPHGDHASGG